jgi:hypothetical protein
MPPDAAAPAIGPQPAPWRWLATIDPQWRAGLVRLAAAWLALIVLFRADWLAMADQWWNSSTYNHVLLVPAIIAWLVGSARPNWHAWYRAAGGRAWC